jgi:hypothetical protein
MQLHVFIRATLRSRLRSTRASLALAIGVALLAASSPMDSLAKLSRARGDESSAEKRKLDGLFASYELLDLDLKSVAWQVETSGRMTLAVGGVARHLELEPVDLRAESFRATVTTVDGVIERRLSPAVHTYKGVVVDEPDSDVRLLIKDDMFFGYLRTSEGWLFVDPLGNYMPGAAPGRVVAYRAAGANRGGVGGGMSDAVRSLSSIEGEGAASIGKVAGLRVIEIAVDADFDFYQAHGEGVDWYILGIIFGVTGIYERELGLSFTVTYMNIWATPDPFAGPDLISLVSSFVSYWIQNNNWVQRDVTHFFTGKPLDVADTGFSYSASVCSSYDEAYSLSLDFAPADLVKVVARYLGRTLGARDELPDVCDGNGPIMCRNIQYGPDYFSEASKFEIAVYVRDHGRCLSTVAEFHTTDGSGGMTLLEGYTDWGDSLDIIVPGNFGGNSWSDLLFYDREAGRGEFFTTDGQGHLTSLRVQPRWRTTWDIIVPGNFGGDGRTDLFFYDRETGSAQFYATDGGGGIHLLSTYTNWRLMWDIIVPGNFGGGTRTDLLLYDRETGIGQFVLTDGRGGIYELATHLDWRSTWDMIVPGNFAGDGRTDLLFYDRETGFAEFYATDGRGGIRFLQAHDYWRSSWDAIVPGNFGGDGRTDLFFYDRTAAHAEFYKSDGIGGIYQLQFHGGMRPRWSLIVPGRFGGDGWTDLLFYER